jgi:tetratricopeptide (TPR) repeat protein
MRYSLDGIKAGYKGEYLLAEKLLKISSKLEPFYAFHHFVLGGIYELMYDKNKEKIYWNKAQKKYEKAILFDSNEGFFHCKLANLYKKRGDINRAIMEYERAVELDPYKPSYRKELGKLYFMTNNFNRALFQLEEAIKIYPLSLEIIDSRVGKNNEKYIKTIEGLKSAEYYLILTKKLIQKN